MSAVLPEDVAAFWFEGDQQANYRNKWFPDGSAQAEIDRVIHTQFGTLLQSAVSGGLKEWESKVSSAIALIVVLDQFSRHIYRHDGLAPDHPLRKQADAEALRIARSLQESHPAEMMCLPVAEFVFSLMPLRHTPTFDHLEEVLSRIRDKEEQVAKGGELLDRFRKQTLRRFQHLQDRRRAEASEEILERDYVQTDEKNIMMHVAVKSTVTFLKKHMPEVERRTRRSSDTATVLFLSLSGGVDSMVLSKVLALLRDQPQFQIDEVVCMHVDYGNRPEAAKERDYVEWWCRDVLHVTCCSRVITEAKRAVTDRDEYEKLTRSIRYSFYQDCQREASERYAERGMTAVHLSGVIFGHHQGDVQENVISNVMRGSSPLFLSGMTEASTANNVVIWRPLLAHPKDCIYDFAHAFGVPYFKDSTPSWSTRGQLRNSLIPALVAVYGSGALKNLTALATESDDLRALVQSNLYEPFMLSVRYLPCGITVNIGDNAVRRQPQSFWREALKQIMHSMGMAMVRDKAVANFVEKLCRPALQPGFVELRKGCHALINAAGDLVVLRAGAVREEMAVVNPGTTLNQLTQRMPRDGGEAAGSRVKRQRRRERRAARLAASADDLACNAHGDDSDADDALCDAEQNDSLQPKEVRRGADAEAQSTNALAAQLQCLALASSPLSAPLKLVVRCTVSAGRVALAADAEQLDRLRRREHPSAVDLAEHNTARGHSHAHHVANVPRGPEHLIIGPWHVWATLESRTDLPAFSTPERMLRQLEDVLSGDFSYCLLLPVQAESALTLLHDAVYSAEMALAERQGQRREDPLRYRDLAALQPLVSADLRAMEVRLREGLPLLVPAKDVASPPATAQVRLRYQYVGSH